MKLRTGGTVNGENNTANEAVGRQALGMNNEELAKQVQLLQEHIALLTRTLAQQQIEMIKMMSFTHAHQACLRDVLIRGGEDRGMLDARMKSAYETAVNSYHDQLESFHESGDAKKFLQAILPDPIMGN